MPRSLPWLALGLLLALLTACREEKVSAQPLKTVPVRTAHPAPLPSKRTLIGTVRARYESELAFRTGGKIVARLVEVGDLVQAGQVLARLDPADHALALQAAEDQLRAAQVDARQAAADEARLQRLLSDRSVANADHERQKSKAEAAAAQHAQARRQRDLSDHKQSYTTLAADREGIVTSIRFESGQVVSEGTPLLTLASRDAWEMVVELPENLAVRADALQATARFWQNVLPETPLILREVAPQASHPGATFRSRFRLPQEEALRQAGLRLGMSATVQVNDQEKTQATQLPATALLQQNSTPFVWVVVQDTQLQQRPVTVLRQESEQVWLAGLQEGEQVVVAGGYKLEAAIPVRAKADSAPANNSQGVTP
ncbi:MAG: efflux RND transporter periplasmic adaptor subunit [Magnetococcales bacterium]|nr:efflux RND transporter periplasmic adaptor subunit [Magnetococcales bacterium]MBF0113967.1 efflux RND transporter periplasmic adaptor subunit [Magnetococcales bacterium]